MMVSKRIHERVPEGVSLLSCEREFAQADADAFVDDNADE
jgi:hypothetical protein